VLFLQTYTTSTTAMECYNCTWTTPKGLPYNLVMRSLESHLDEAQPTDLQGVLIPLEASVPAPRNASDPAPREDTQRPQDHPRPKLEEDCPEDNWNHF
jgi:hypothetical protein